MALDSLFVPLVSAVIAVVGAVMLSKFFSRNSPLKTLVDKETKYKLKLLEKKVLNHDTRIFRFALPSNDHILGLPIGQHIYTSATIDGSLIIRPYTPISSDEDKGFMELLIKVYFKDTHPKFPAGGKMTQHMESLKVGDTIDVRGPSGLLVYEGDGKFKIQPKKTAPAKEFKYKKLCMMAGGSGITPMYQMIKHMLSNKADPMKLWLIFANQTEDDILLRQELDDLCKAHADRFSVWYTVDRPKEGWTYSSGFISPEMVSTHLCPPGDDVLVTMCGPPPMVQFACIPALDKLGYPQEQRFSF